MVHSAIFDGYFSIFDDSTNIFDGSNRIFLLSKSHKQWPHPHRLCAPVTSSRSRYASDLAGAPGQWALRFFLGDFGTAYWQQEKKIMTPVKVLRSLDLRFPASSTAHPGHAEPDALRTQKSCWDHGLWQLPLWHFQQVIGDPPSTWRTLSHKSLLYLFGVHFIKSVNGYFYFISPSIDSSCHLNLKKWI